MAVADTKKCDITVGLTTISEISWNDTPFCVHLSSRTHNTLPCAPETNPILNTLLILQNILSAIHTTHNKSVLATSKLSVSSSISSIQTDIRLQMSCSYCISISFHLTIHPNSFYYTTTPTLFFLTSPYFYLSSFNNICHFKQMKHHQQVY